MPDTMEREHFVHRSIGRKHAYGWRGESIGVAFFFVVAIMIGGGIGESVAQR